MNEITMFFNLLVALFLGSFMGVERAIAGKGAGLRTYALVSMGSALFIIISESVILHYDGVLGADPTRMAAAIVTGIGFIGAGLFIFREQKVHNITTAAGMWVASGIGIACGYGLFTLAFMVSILTLFTFTFLWFVEKKIKYLADKLLD